MNIDKYQLFFYTFGYSLRVGLGGNVHPVVAAEMLSMNYSANSGCGGAEGTGPVPVMRSISCWVRLG